MSKIAGALLVACLVLSAVACGDEDALRRQVQDLEDQRAELITMNEKLKMDNDDLQAKMLELRTEVETLREAVMPRDTTVIGNPAVSASGTVVVPTGAPSGAAASARR